MNKALHAVVLFAVLSTASFEAAAQAKPGDNTTFWIYAMVGATVVIGFIIAFTLSKRRDKQERENAGKPPAT